MIPYLTLEDLRLLHWILRNDYPHPMIRGIFPRLTLHPMVLHRLTAYYKPSIHYNLFIVVYLLLTVVVLALYHCLLLLSNHNQ